MNNELNVGNTRQGYVITLIYVKHYSTNNHYHYKVQFSPVLITIKHELNSIIKQRNNYSFTYQSGEDVVTEGEEDFEKKILLPSYLQYFTLPRVCVCVCVGILSSSLSLSGDLELSTIMDSCEITGSKGVMIRKE